MANGKNTTQAPGSRSAPQVVSPRNRTNVALPLSFARFTTLEPAMTVRDWISLTGLAVSVIGFSVVIWRLTQAANAREAGGPVPAGAGAGGETMITPGDGR
jgi:hypothetical protein